MKLNDNYKKCVAFLQYQMSDGSFGYAGTCFFILHKSETKELGYVVTAKHVLDGVKHTGVGEIYIRLNLKDGETRVYETQIADWITHSDQTVDVAILPSGLPNEVDHLFYPSSACLTKEVEITAEISCGEEVVIAGLFKHHAGTNRNSPIVRVGNIALMPSEMINVSGQNRDVYLIESRSIGGLSGSPVFINLGHTRMIGGQIKQAGEYILPLFGIVLGHFDSDKNDIDSVSDSSDFKGQVNSGIAIVTPVAKLIEMLNLESAFKISK
ncbi:MAG: serine protease [Gammaproteobacteria bacterium]|nr:serine protease [Gammaproteobacteria bacterium]